MKRKNFVLLLAVLFVGLFSFTGCSTKKNYEMSYEQVISLLENQSKEMMEIFFNFEAQQRDVNLFTKIDNDDVNLDLDIQTQSKIDYNSKVQDVALYFDADVKISESELDLITSWEVNYSLIWDDMYLKLSDLSLDWPSATDLAMVAMIVNGFKWQWFKLGMSGVNMSKAFELYSLYGEKMWDIVKNVWEIMVNEWSLVYDWMFDEYKWYNARKYSVDEEKFDEMLHMYVDMMNEFYSWLLAQYAENLWDEEINLVDFNDIFSGVEYDNLQWYFVVVWNNDVVETMENAHMTIDGTWIVANYYYWKDWLYFEAKTEDWEDLILLVAKKNWKVYDIYANFNSMFSVKWDMKFNKFSKKDWVDVDFDLNLSVSVDPEMFADPESVKDLDMEIPFKWNYRVKNINKFSLEAPSDAIDLMEMLWWFMWAGIAGDDEYREDDEYDYLDDDWYETVGIPVATAEFDE